MSLHVWLGLVGVESPKNKAGFYWDKASDVANLMVVLVLLLYWSRHAEHADLLGPEIIFNGLIWLWFFLDVNVGATLSRQKASYLTHNWFKLVIIGLVFPPVLGKIDILVLYRLLHPIVGIILLSKWSDAALASLRDNHLGTTLMTFFVVMIVAAFLITGLDPSIHSAWEGFWWVLVTMSTVGYGDIVPISVPGRVLASLLILLGLGFFSIVTANVAALFLGKKIKEDQVKLLELVGDLPTAKPEGNLVEVLDSFSHRLTQIEKRLYEQEKG